MKKVLYLHAGAEMYGADKILLEIVQNLDRQKYTPIVILPESGPLVLELKKANIEVQVLSYPIVRRQYFTPVGVLKFIGKYLKYSKKLENFVKLENIDIVHVNTTAVWEGVWLKYRTNVKIVWHVHEIILHPRIVYQVITRLLQAASDKIIAVSDATKAHLLENKIIDSSKVIVVHNGIKASSAIGESKLDVSQLAENATVIGMVGRINAWKGQADFLAAVKQNLERRSDTFALVVGSPYKGQEERLNQLNATVSEWDISLKQRIAIVPFQKDVASVYRLIDIFVMPSTLPDPFPTVVLEAMANGIPVVGYRHGGVCEMIQDNKSGFLVPVGNVSALSIAIQQLVDSPDKRQMFGENARNRQQTNFELSSFVTKVQEIYSDVVE